MAGGSMMVEMTVEGACVTRVTRGVADDAWSVVPGPPARPRAAPAAARAAVKCHGVPMRVLERVIFIGGSFAWSRHVHRTEHTSITITRSTSGAQEMCAAQRPPTDERIVAVW